MKINKKSWHFKLLVWLKTSTSLPQNICDYILQIFLSLVALSFCVGVLGLTSSIIGAEAGSSVYFKLLDYTGDFLNLKHLQNNLLMKDAPVLDLITLYKEGLIPVVFITIIGCLYVGVFFISLIWVLIKLMEYPHRFLDKVKNSCKCPKAEYFD